MAISILLAGLELVWSLQVDHSDPKVDYESFYENILQAQMDLFYYIIFWLQSFFIVLPFGMIGRHFLEFWKIVIYKVLPCVKETFQNLAT